MRTPLPNAHGRMLPQHWGDFMAGNQIWGDRAEVTGLISPIPGNDYPDWMINVQLVYPVNLFVRARWDDTGNAENASFEVVIGAGRVSWTRMLVTVANVSSVFEGLLIANVVASSLKVRASRAAVGVATRRPLIVWTGMAT